MQEIYKSALRKARRMVFNNDKYSEIIVFCKYKIDKNIYDYFDAEKEAYVIYAGKSGDDFNIPTKVY